MTMTTDATFPRRFADRCNCHWAQEDPDFHDRLLRLEDEEHGMSVGLLLLETACLGDFTGESPPLGNDPNEFERFVFEHNWQDPVFMANLARLMSCVSEGYWKGVGACAGRVTVT